MTKGNILLVDDEPRLVSVLRSLLEAAGYGVAIAVDGVSAIDGVVSNEPDLLLVDLCLPDVDGKEVIRAVREASRTPIIVLSARHQAAEKVAALDMGADDYIDKPFEINVLFARIRAAMRRVRATELSPAVFEHGPLRIDFTKREVEILGEPVRLSRKEYLLLHTLARSAGQVVPHKRLLAAAWGSELVDSQYLRVYIGLLRQKIEEDSARPKIIITEPGAGYRLRS